MKRHLILILIGLSLLPWGSIADEEKAIPQGIIAPPESSFSIKIEADHDVYSPKEPVKIHLELSRDAYVYVYDINAEGQVTLLFPNDFSRDNLLKAGRYTLPDRPSYSFVVTEPFGVELLQALALLKPLPILSLSGQGDLDRYPFPKLSDNPKELKGEVQELIEITVSPGEWAADWTQFLVVPAVAYLKISSQPEGAQVYINGELRGQSPLELELKPGRVHISLVREGYQRWSKAITLENHEHSELNVRLERTPPPLLLPSPIYPPSAPDEEVLLHRLSLGLNAGLNREGIFSAGLELGFPSGFSLGGSISFTQEEVPEYFDIGRPEPFARERVYNQGPETEAYLKLSLPLAETFYLHLGAGVAVQERVHIAAPEGVIIVSALRRPLIEILPNGYREEVSFLTAFGGAAIRVGSNLLSLSLHNRRGFVLGLTLIF